MVLARLSLMAFRARSKGVGPARSGGNTKIGGLSGLSAKCSLARRSTPSSTLMVSLLSSREGRRQCPHWKFCSLAFLKHRLCRNFPKHGMTRQRTTDWMSNSNKQMKHRSLNGESSGPMPCNRRLCLEAMMENHGMCRSSLV